jgi:hypothetical protein
MHKLFLLIFFLSVNCQAEFFSGTFEARKTAPVKVRTLISDCMTLEKMNKFTHFSFETPPSDDGSPVQSLYAAKWRSDHGPARAVVNLHWNELNRFNETIPKVAQCRFYGDNYEIGNNFKLPL